MSEQNTKKSRLMLTTAHALIGIRITTMYLQFVQNSNFLRFFRFGLDTNPSIAH